MIQQFRDPVQQLLHRPRAIGWQGQFDPVLVLNHPHRQLEQLQDDGHRLCLRQAGMHQCVVAQAVDQGVRRAGIEQAQMVGQEGVGGCLLYTSPSPRDRTRSRMPSSA